MKHCVDDLAIFGGSPSFCDPLHVGRPNIGNREHIIARIRDLLDRKWLTNTGLYVREFERRIANMIGVRHCVAMCNGTMALEIAIRAAGLSGEVIVPSFTFVATAHALQWQGITPVFCDIRADTHTLDPSLIEDLITPRTRGIIGVHLWGRPCDVEALANIARRHNLKLLFDAAHAFGCSKNGHMIGAYGDAEVFSFHATKFLNSFEGGAVVTNDDGLANRIRLMKNFGFVDYDNVDSIGTNGKMSEVSAAMGLTSLESMEEFIKINYQNYKQYDCELNGISQIQIASYDEIERNNYQYIVLELNDKLIDLNRDELQQILWAEGILARRYFYPGCHRMEPYRSFRLYASHDLPITERVAARVLTLPTGTAIEADEIHEICGVIRFVLSHSSEIHERLSAKKARSTVIS